MLTATTVYGAPDGYDALLLIRRAREHTGTILHIARNEQRMVRLSELLAFFAPDIEVLRFPAWDCLPYDRVSPNPAVVSERIATLSRLLDPPSSKDGLRILLTTVNAAVQRVPPRLVFLGESFDVRAGATLRPEKLVAYLESHGYGRADTVMEPGEYAVRGGIIDVFPSGEGDPVRLDFFGDTVESVRRFDPSTQRSTEKAEKFLLRPVSEVTLDAESVARFRTAWRELFSPAAATDPIYQAISDGRRYPGMEHWVPLFTTAWKRCWTTSIRRQSASTTSSKRRWRHGSKWWPIISKRVARRRAMGRSAIVRCRRIGCIWIAQDGTPCLPKYRR